MACNSIAPVQGYGNPYQTGLNASADLPGTSANQDAIRQHATDHNIPEDQLGQALTALQGALARRPPDANEIKRIVAELANLFETNGAGAGTAGAAGAGGPSANDAGAPEQTVEEALRALGIPPDVIDRIVAARQNMASQTSPHVASLQSSPASTTGNAAPAVSNGGHGGGNGGGSVGNASNVSNAGGNGGHGGIAALAQHVNGILADGRDHGFQNGIDSYVPRIQEAMCDLQQAGIVTAKDPFDILAYVNEGDSHFWPLMSERETRFAPGFLFSLRDTFQPHPRVTADRRTRLHRITLRVPHRTMA